eukprot:635059-Pleurochrysis_carterae.AAC.2
MRARDQARGANANHAAAYNVASSPPVRSLDNASMQTEVNRAPHETPYSTPERARVSIPSIASRLGGPANADLAATHLAATAAELDSIRDQLTTLLSSDAPPRSHDAPPPATSPQRDAHCTPQSSRISSCTLLSILLNVTALCIAVAIGVHQFWKN